MTRPRGARLGRSLLWSAALVALLAGADRLLLGPRAPRGWVAVASIEAVPRAAGRVTVPAYLSPELSWPPGAVYYRLGDHPAWWLAVRPRAGGGPRLWLGSGAAPFPEAIGEPARLLDPATHGGAPSGWHYLSTQAQGGVTVHVLAALDPSEVERILAGIR